MCTKKEHKGRPSPISWGRMADGMKEEGSMDENFIWGQIIFVTGF